ncbi:MAG: hypothetical protein OEN48_16565 [Betaproteobacteria bacterium]|nr:hypothetical protein [Betaproteobacteria bacterium]
MVTNEALQIFAAKFVKRAFQDRFVHEAIKKPARLMTRICHRISDVFEDRFRDGTCTLKPDDQCFLFELTGRHQETNWSAATQHMDKYGGGGYLVIEATGQKFYAQSEGFPSPETYAG